MKTGNTAEEQASQKMDNLPQWSPVMKTGNTCALCRCARVVPPAPQWSPVMKTGNTSHVLLGDIQPDPPQWSPVMKTGNTTLMLLVALADDEPQWSPVMKTGNTRWRGIAPRSMRCLNGARS